MLLRSVKRASMALGAILIAALTGGCTMQMPALSSISRAAHTLAPPVPAETSTTRLSPLPVKPEALSAYHKEVKRLVVWYDTLPVAQRESACAALGLTVQLDETGETGLNRFTPASEYGSGPLENRHTRPGVGVPVVAWRLNDGTGPLDSHRPPEGLSAPMTAVVLPQAGGKWLLRFVSPVDHASIDIAGRSVTVAADYTAPIAQLAERARPLARSGLSGMLSSTTSERREKLYLMQPYDPQKIPLLMVHGLQSTPLAFVNLTNDLVADPMVRQRYQVWHYHYPTGAPVLQNAAVFRRVLSSTLREIDPEGNDFATNNLVVIGHSMGGILTHTLVSPSGYRLWDAVVKVRPEQVSMPEASKEALTPVFLFQPDRRVRRVVFIAVPHRGSGWADNFIGDLGQTLFRPDREIHSVFTDLITSHPEQVHSFVLGLHQAGKFSSIRTLSARSPALMALAEIPPEVPFHNIIGQRRAGPVDEGNDGIVPYGSSHMAGAESELVVRSGHNAFRHPEAVAEIKRILYEHLRHR
jgi:hypothetical protein